MNYTYKKYKNAPDIVSTSSILRKEDNAVIPFDPANIDYQEYLKWKAEGNTAEAAD